MPERTVLEQAANVARLLGDNHNANLFVRAHDTHVGNGGKCPAQTSLCAFESQARDYLAEHTDGDNIVVHIRADFDAFRQAMQLAKLRLAYEGAMFKLQTVLLAAGKLAADKTLLQWLHAEAVHKATLCGAVGYWGTRNTRYECDKPRHHAEQEHENRAEDIPLVWFGHHPEPEVDRG